MLRLFANSTYINHRTNSLVASWSLWKGSSAQGTNLCRSMVRHGSNLCFSHAPPFCQLPHDWVDMCGFPGLLTAPRDMTWHQAIFSHITTTRTCRMAMAGIGLGPGWDAISWCLSCKLSTCFFVTKIHHYIMIHHVFIDINMNIDINISMNININVLMRDDWCNPFWWNERFCKFFIEDMHPHCEWIHKISSPVPFITIPVMSVPPYQVKGQVSRISKGFLCWLDFRGRIVMILPTLVVMSVIPTPPLGDQKDNDFEI